MSTNNGWAFPTTQAVLENGTEGITARDYFAAAASDSDIHDMKCSLTTRITRQEARYRCADAMLAARQAEAVPAVGMSDELFRALLDRATSPVNSVSFLELIEAEAKRRGYSSWVKAGYDFLKEADQ